MLASKNQVALIIGQGQASLGNELAALLEIHPFPLKFEKFSSGEILLELLENPKDKDIYILSTPLYPGHDEYMELFLIMDAVSRHGARNIIPIIPYFGYGRQNRCFGPYSPMPCDLLAKLFKAAGATALITIDLHDPKIRDFFSIPLHHLSFIPLIVSNILERFGSEVVIISPDAGGIERAKEVAQLIKAPFAAISKKRITPQDVKVLDVDGDVAGKTAIIVDDLVDSGNTLCKAAGMLREKGAGVVHAYVTHSLLSTAGYKKLQESFIESLTLTNSLPDIQHSSKKIKEMSLALLLAETINTFYL